MNIFEINIDVSEITDLINKDEIMEFVEDVVDEMMVDIFTDIVSPAPLGVAVDTGEARNSVQIDRSNPLNQEIYSTADYMKALEDGHSPQSDHSFQRSVDKHTD